MSVVYRPEAYLLMIDHCFCKVLFKIVKSLPKHKMNSGFDLLNQFSSPTSIGPSPLSHLSVENATWGSEKLSSTHQLRASTLSRGVGGLTTRATSAQLGLGVNQGSRKIGEAS